MSEDRAAPTVDEMRADITRLADKVAMKDMPVDVRAYLADNLWPFLEGVVDRLEEHDGLIDECIEQTEDVLHAETAQLIGKPIGVGMALCTELERRLGGTPVDMKVRAMVAEYRVSAKIALETLQDIAIPDDPDADDEPASPANQNGPDDDADDDDEDEGEEEPS